MVRNGLVQIGGLRYRVKFVIQILCALLIVASGIWLNDFHGLFGLAGLSPWFGVPFSVLLVVFIINAINLIDGIDGLASGLSIVSAFFFGIMFCYEGYWGFAMLAFSLMGTSNARCPVCHKKMELKGKGDAQIFVCRCGHKEKLKAFEERRKKEGAGVTKKDVARYLNQQKKEAEEPVNNAFAKALAGLNLKDKG